MGKGSATTTNATSTAPNPQAAAAYSQLLQQAQGVASTPYQAYQGELTAPVNSQQQQGISGINANANFAQPAVNQAIGIAGNAAQPLTQQQIQQYQNPYTQDVVNATQAQFNNQNAQQQASLTGNAISQGALGGNRVGVAQGTLAGQQQLAQAPVIAGLYSQSYNQGLSTAENQFQQNPLSAAGSLANFGISGQGAALSGAGAQLGAGTLEQQTQQAADTANYGQYTQAQAYPFQTTQWLAGVDTGVGSQLGGTSSGQTTAPAPNPLTQWLGLGTAGIGAAGQAGVFSGPAAAARGGRINFSNGGGVVPHMAVGGTPWSDAQGWVPTVSIAHGSGAPHASAPSAATATGIAPSNYSSIANGLTGIFASNPAYGGGNMFTGTYGGSSSNPLPGLDKSDYGPGYARGGVAGYADGGAPDFGYAFDPSIYAPAKPSAGVAPSDSQAPIYDDGQGPFRIDPGKRPVGDATALKGTGIAPSSDPDDDTPEEATPTSGRGMPSGAASGVAPAAQFTPPYSIGPGDVATPSPTASPWAALTTAGLAMMANRSPFLGVGVGEGAMAGLNAYGGAKEADRKALEDAQKLSLEAKEKANAQALSTYNVNHKGDMTDYQEGELKLKRQEMAQGKYTPAGSTVTTDGAIHPLVLDQKSGTVIDAVTGKAPATDAKIIPKGTAQSGFTPESEEIVARQTLNGDYSGLTNVGRGAQAGATVEAVRNHAAQILIHEKNFTPQAAADYMSGKLLEFKQQQAEAQATGRVGGTREANLNIILNATEAAIPAALQASAELSRTGLVPLNKIIENGRFLTSDPAQVKFGMANLQLAEHWARAMNPLGVMRESDRELAMKYLNTALSSGAYEQAVQQLHTQIMRERDAVKHGSTTIPSSGLVVPGETGGGAAAGQPGTSPQTKTIDGVTYVNRNGQWFAQ